MKAAGARVSHIAQTMQMSQRTVYSILRRHGENPGDVKDRPCSGRRRATTGRECRALVRLARQQRYATSSTLRNHWPTNVRVSTRTVRTSQQNEQYRLKMYFAFIMCLIADKCIFIFQVRLAWAQQMQRHNIAYWRRVPWSNECRFILYKSDGRVRVWRRRVERFHPDCIQPRIAFGGGSVTLLTVIVLSLLSFCLFITWSHCDI